MPNWLLYGLFGLIVVVAILLAIDYLLYAMTKEFRDEEDE